MISAANLQEQNPLGITLPQVLAKRLNQMAQRYFPAKWVEKNNRVTGLELKTEVNEAVQRQDSVAMAQ